MFYRALIAAAVTAAFAAPAFADVSISGSAEMDIYARTHQASSQKADGSSSTALGNETDLILNFDGTDKLDSGNKLIWRVSQKVATPKTAEWGSREAYIGLAGDWGTFRSGRVFAPSYLALDQFQWGAGNLWEDYGANGVWFKEALAYSTPTFNGFGAQVAYDLGTKTAQGQTWAVDAIATYNNKDIGLNLAGGYQQQKGLTALNQDDAFISGGDTGAKQEFYFVQGNWDIARSGFTVRGGYKHNKWSDSNNSLGFGAGKVENDQFLLAGAYAWNKSQLALGWQDIVNSKIDGQKFNDANANQFFGQYTYTLSKNTSAYLQARYMKFKDADVRPFAAADWQLDGVASTGTDNGARVLIGTWTGF
ncbi:putative porin [Silvimonas terrae]|uniref:Putative porin n=1 Tax=Silvimonas terrae TaxID=300266 RepID=A0A840RJU0_9NEIS|nr:porin [Silvimonas terrae]MBB5192512.1 putative porin [Silvimonas terrae]